MAVVIHQLALICVVLGVRIAARTSSLEPSSTGALIPGGTKLDSRNVPAKFSGTLAKVDPVQAALISKRKLPKEGVRAFPGKASAASASHAADDEAKESSEKDASARLTGSGLADEAKASSNDVQLLMDLLGPDFVPDEELVELMRLSSAAAPSETPGFLRIDQSKLPLEMFDDDVRAPRCAPCCMIYTWLCARTDRGCAFVAQGYEKFPPSLWLSVCRSGLSPMYNGGVWTWRPVNVVGFEDDKFIVEFKGSGRRKAVKRINLLFDKEDKLNFCARLRGAIVFREKTKAAIRFQHYVDMAPSDSLAPISDGWLKSIHTRALSFAQRRRAAASVGHSRSAGGSKGLDASDVMSAVLASPSLAALIAEVVEEYDMAMKVRLGPLLVLRPVCVVFKVVQDSRLCS